MRVNDGVAEIALSEMEKVMVPLILNGEAQNVQENEITIDLFTADMPRKWVNILEEKTVNIDKLCLGESPFDRRFHKHILLQCCDFLLRLFQLVSVSDIQLVFEHIGIRIAVNRLHRGIHIIL